MPKSPKRYINDTPKSKFKPPESPEEAEKLASALAMNLVIERLRDGSATSQETTYFLKLNSQREKYENELAKARIEKEKAQAESIKKSEANNDLYEKALNAFRGYSGKDDEYDDDSDLY